MISNRFGAHNTFHTAPNEKFQGVKPVKQSGQAIGLFRPIQHHVKCESSKSLILLLE